MRKIYKLWSDAFYGTLFFSETGRLIAYVHENDGDWRNEYFRPILEHLGAEMVMLDVALEFLDDQCECGDPYRHENEIERIVTEAIKSSR